MPVALEPAQRLADGRPARREVRGELLLDEPLAERHLAAQQPAAQPRVDPVGLRGAAPAARRARARLVPRVRVHQPQG